MFGTAAPTPVGPAAEPSEARPRSAAGPRDGWRSGERPAGRHAAPAESAAAEPSAEPVAAEPPAAEPPAAEPVATERPTATPPADPAPTAPVQAPGSAEHSPPTGPADAALRDPAADRPKDGAAGPDEPVTPAAGLATAEPAGLGFATDDTPDPPVQPPALRGDPPVLRGDAAGPHGDGPGARAVAPMVGPRERPDAAPSARTPAAAFSGGQLGGGPAARTVQPRGRPGRSGIGRPAVPVQPDATDDAWGADEEHADRAAGAWLLPQLQGARTRAPQGTSALGAPPARRSGQRPPRRPATGLAALVLLALVATFFAWVSAEPLWLAVGHGDRGTATVTRCTGNGIGQRCIGQFAAADGSFTASSVTLLGVAAEDRQPGAAVGARMVDPASRQAYVSAGGVTLHLRWAVGLALVLLCGLGIVAATGARRLETRRARQRAVLASIGGPLLLVIGFLAASF